MPITERQREARKLHLGGTDLHKMILGNAYEVWADKVLPLSPIDPNEAMWTGTMLESAVLDMAEDKLGKLKRGQGRRIQGTPILTNIDAILWDSDIPVEAKTSGIVSRFTDTDVWGTEGTDEIPIPYIFQAHAHMMAMQRGLCHVVALIGGRGFCMFVVKFNEALAKQIRERSIDFWQHHIDKKVPPGADWNKLCAPTMDVVKRMQRVPDKIVPIDSKTVERYEELKKFSKLISGMEESAKASVLAQLGDAEASEPMPDGRQVTYFEQSRSTIRAADLKREHPEIAAQYASTSTSRVLRVRAARKELT